MIRHLKVDRARARRSFKFNLKFAVPRAGLQCGDSRASPGIAESRGRLRLPAASYEKALQKGKRRRHAGRRDRDRAPLAQALAAAGGLLKNITIHCLPFTIDFALKRRAGLLKHITNLCLVFYIQLPIYNPFPLDSRKCLWMMKSTMAQVTLCRTCISYCSLLP